MNARFTPASVTALLAALLLAPPVTLGHALAATEPRSLEAACPDHVPSAGFVDTAESVHRKAIDCVVHWRLARGRGEGRFSPTDVVTRGQAASFLARLLEESGATLPAPASDRFTDDDGDVHESSIERLAAAGVVTGLDGARFAPTAPVTRAQAAALLVRAYAVRAEQDDADPLPPGPDAFADDDDAVLETDIDTAASAGIVTGLADGRYHPGRDVQRAAFASVLARTLDALAAAGHVPALPDLRNGQAFVQDNLWSTETEEYAVWVDADGRPWAGKRALDDPDWQSVDLSLVPGNPLAAPTEDDTHNVYAIAVDALGHVHIAGNMHVDPLRYVRTTRPGDLSSLVAGQIDGPAETLTYPQFVATPDGHLLLLRRQGAPGHGRLVADRLERGSQEWRSLGTVVDGTASGESPYPHHVAVDRASGRVHLLVVWRDTPDVATNRDVSYAVSPDGGLSWETSHGTPVSLPMTHATMEQAMPTLAGSGLRNSGGLTVDAQGRPHAAVLFDPPGPERRVVHLWHDRTGWRERDLPGELVDGRPAVAGLADGRLVVVGERRGALHAVDITPGTPPTSTSLAAVPDRWEATYDSQLLAREGRLRMLVPDGARPRVVELRP